MPTINIPHGQERDAWIEVSVNGNVHRIKAGVDVEVSAAIAEALANGGMEFTSVDDGDLPPGAQAITYNGEQVTQDGEPVYIEE